MFELSLNNLMILSLINTIFVLLLIVGFEIEELIHSGKQLSIINIARFRRPKKAANSLNDINPYDE